MNFFTILFFLDKPPEIGPRIKIIAPKPPPRPSKAAELVQRKFDMLKKEKENGNIDETNSTPILDVSVESKKILSKNTVTNELKANDISSTSLILDTFNNDESLRQTPLITTFSKQINSENINNEESELLTPNKTKTLTLKKKNSMLAKRRRICLKALEFSDIQGHLFRRTKDKHGVTYWAKLYFVLVETALYGFRNKRSQKANCLIFLPGFTVSLAKEVHSKPFAYKVYHPKKTFYFAAESQEALSQWMDYIKRATLKGSSANIDPVLVESIDNKDLFSETESSEVENDVTNEDIPQPMSFKKNRLGGGKANKKRSPPGDTSRTTHAKSDKYHLGFGSLKKFTNLHNLPFSNKTEKERYERKKAQSDIPVPTAQYKSYRKIPGNAGMQLGSNTLVEYNIMAQRLPQGHTHLNMASISNSVISEEDLSKLNDPDNVVVMNSNTSISNASAQHELVPLGATNNLSKTTATLTETNIGIPQQQQQQQQTKNHDLVNRTISKLSKNKSFNYMHASNPNLVEFTFQTSKTLDVGIPKVNASNNFEQHQNLQGFITLKDLMLQREEDEAHNMYNNRVNLGVEKPNDRHTRRKHRRPNELTSTEINRLADENGNTPLIVQKPTVNKIQRRSLPKTPDYAQSFKADDSEIIMARSKEGQKLRDFGYEFISGDDANNGNVASNINNNSIETSSSVNAVSTHKHLKSASLAKPNELFLLATKRKGLNWRLNLDSKRDESKIIGKGSFKIIKHKYQETVDMNRSKNDNANRNANEIPTPGQANILSVNGASYLSKLTFPAKTVKEKRLLGSPRLHRAASSIFGRKYVEGPTYDQQITSHTHGSSTLTSYDQDNNALSINAMNTISFSNNEGESKTNTTKSASLSGAINYTSSSAEQSIEYPPVFIPETYSFSRNPNSTQ